MVSDALAPSGSRPVLSPSLRAQLAEFLTSPLIKVRQSRELLQALVGLNTANRYEVTSKDDRPLFVALERGGAWNFLSRRFNPFYENLTECKTAAGELVMTVAFRWAIWFQKADVFAAGGEKLGRVKRRFHFFRTRADVLSPSGEVELRLRGPWFKFFFFTDWVFSVEQGGRTVGHVRKKWGGFIAEAVTNADTFYIELEPTFTDERLRLLLVASSFLLDLARFEEKDKNVKAQVEGTAKGRTFDD